MKTLNEALNRRNFISTAAVFATTVATARFAFADPNSASNSSGNTSGDSSEEKNQDHSHHHKAGGTPESNLALAASQCVAKGEACLQHCMDLLVKGDTSMANCSKTVREMMIYCQALSKAGFQDSKYLKQLAKIAMNACAECETECRKHAQKHDVCKECADSCAECYKLCKNII